MSRVHLALVHHPVRDRSGETITTAVTNLDVHDIARTARTYDLAGYHVLTPIEAQRRLVARILEHWIDGAGARRVPERGEALRLCRTATCLSDLTAELTALEGARPLVAVTGARPPAAMAVTGYPEARETMARAPTLLLFGTGHGLTREVVEAADLVLAPIRPEGSYNHLSVRAAVAITLDRLFGDAGAH